MFFLHFFVTAPAVMKPSSFHIPVTKKIGLMLQCKNAMSALFTMVKTKFLITVMAVCRSTRKIAMAQQISVSLYILNDPPATEP